MAQRMFLIACGFVYGEVIKEVPDFILMKDAVFIEHPKDKKFILREITLYKINIIGEITSKEGADNIYGNIHIRDW